MLVYGRRRCSAGVYMLDAENFESIVAELKSEQTCLKMRSRGQCNGGGSHYVTGVVKNHNESRSNIISTSNRKIYEMEPSQKQTVNKPEKTLSSSRKNVSHTEYSPKGQSTYAEEKVKSQTARSRTCSEQTYFDGKHKPRDVLNNRRCLSSPKESQRNSNSGNPTRRLSESDSCGDPPVRWIKNDFKTCSSHEEEPSINCKSCDKEASTSVKSNKTLSSNGLSYIGNNTLMRPTVHSSRNAGSNLHSLIHYTTGKPILLYDYSEDNCPVCLKSLRKQGHLRSRKEPPLDESATQSIAQSSHQSQFSNFSKAHPHYHPTSLSSTQPSDCLDISCKTFSHTQGNICCSQYDVKSSLGVGHRLDVQESSLACCEESSDTISLPPTSAQATKLNGSCRICSQSRCSQCTWSQLFYDSYYRVYYMYPQQNPFGMNNSVFLDLTNKNYTLSVERPYLDESEVRSLLKNAKRSKSSRVVESTYYQSHSDFVNYEDKGPATMWSAEHHSTPFSSGPIVCISMPHMEKLKYTNTSLVPPLSFVEYCGSAPPDRTWRHLCEPVQGAIQFTLMCYNILCEKYASQQVYPYCPSWALNWVYRRTTILDEIRLYTADIICLQEVEMDQYELHFEKLLKTLGYSGIFSPKSRAHHMTDAERRKVDGCAIFWKTERFRLVKDTVIEFSRMAMERYENDCKESPEMLNRVMVRDNIALSAILETKESSQPQQFMVSTAHIHWDPEYSDVKLIQSIMHVSSLYQKIEEHLLEQNGGKTPVNPANMPLIVCGDFNSLPQSGVVEFLTQGRVAKSHPDFKNLGYVKVLDKLCGRRRHGRNNGGDHDVLQHDFVLGRAYDSGDGMRYTNYTYDFKGIIDYIFYTKNHFNVLGNLEMICENWLKKEKIPGCPHPHIPSDHFPLLVELELQLPSDHSHSRK